MPIPRQKIAPKREVLSIRPIQREDLPRLLKPRDKSASIPHKLRESHHTIARLLATGIDYMRVAALTGYSYNRVSQLASAPAMQELIAKYRDSVDQTWIESLDSYYELATRNMLKAERMLADKLEDAEEANEPLPVRDLISISRDAADRFGYGKRTTQTNVNIDFAAELEKRIARREGKVVELNPNPTSIRRIG